MTDTIHDETTATINKYLVDNWDAVTTPIDWENRLNTATSGYTQFIKALIAPVDSNQSTMCGPNNPRNGITRNYLLVFSIYVRLDKGDGVIRQLADTRAVFEVPSSPRQVDTDQKGWYRKIMNFPFYVRN